MGSSLLETGSILAAFFAGGVALFAPCCIVFLAPSYLAVAVKNRRWKLLPLTFVFAAGLSLVLVPITLGVSLVAATISKYHAPLYYVGGLLMLALAAYALSGRMWTVPSFLRAPDTTAGDTGSFFALGVFSGIASSCCAPVLAGVMTLSALSGSVAGGVALGLAFVLGMTFPLFLLALLWDRFDLGERRWLRARPLTIRVGRRRLHTNSVNAAVAVAFTAMGAGVLWLATSEQMTTGPGFQTAIGRWLTRVFGGVLDWTDDVPEPVLGLAVLALAAVLVVAALRDRGHAGRVDRPEPDPTPSCHEHHTEV